MFRDFNKYLPCLTFYKKKIVKIKLTGEGEQNEKTRKLGQRLLFIGFVTAGQAVGRAFTQSVYCKSVENSYV